MQPIGYVWDYRDEPEWAEIDELLECFQKPSIRYVYAGDLDSKYNDCDGVAVGERPLTKEAAQEAVRTAAARKIHFPGWPRKDAEWTWSSAS